jgi:peptide-methionine (S)-S-oxide reductase
VVRTRVGYAGGAKANPTYHALGDHTESIEILYDPKRISYAQLLDVFWAGHDPRRQTPSRQYRNAVFTQGAEQAQVAQESRDRLAAKLGKPVGTDLEPLTHFWPAEDYHQKYYLRRSRELVAELIRLTGDESAFMDSTAAARLNAYFGNDTKAGEVSRSLADLGFEAPTVEKLMMRIRGAAGE